MSKKLIVAVVFGCMLTGLVAAPMAQAGTFVESRTLHYVPSRVWVPDVTNVVWVPPVTQFVAVPAFDICGRVIGHRTETRIIHAGYYKTVVIVPGHWEYR